MSNNVKQSIARIRRAKDGEVCGAGFLITAQHILTCAHVVADALGISPYSLERPNGDVELDLPFLNSNERWQAEIELWLPIESKNHVQLLAREDIAVLKLRTSLSNIYNQLPTFEASHSLAGLSVHCVGFPRGYDNGTHASGRISGDIVGGCFTMEAEKSYGYFVEKGFSGAPIWGSDNENIVGMIVGVEENSALRVACFIPVTELAKHIPALGRLILANERPYLGLNAFTEKKQHLFFGREEFAKELFKQVQHRQFIAVVGPSGSGKSSVVQAGLLPLLHQERSPKQTWKTITFRPGKTPFDNLAVALVETLKKEAEMPKRLQYSAWLGNKLASNEMKLVAVLGWALREFTDTQRLLIVVDQFEELLMLKPLQEQVRFIKLLLSAITLSEVTIIITLRADFLSQAISTSVRELSECIAGGQVTILPMIRSQLHQVIFKPASKHGLIFESGLVEGILNDVEDHSGVLPLLEFALTELWNQRQGNELTHDRYNHIGRVKGVIGKRAEGIFQNLSLSSQNIATTALTRIIQLSGDGLGISSTRQRIWLEDFRADERDIMMQFVEARLFVVDRDPITNKEFIEVAHEVVLTEWERLQGISNDERQFLRWREGFGFSLETWRKSNRAVSDQLHGTLLEEAKKLLKERPSNFNKDEKFYIEVSGSIPSMVMQKVKTVVKYTLIMLLITFLLYLYDYARPDRRLILEAILFAVMSWRITRFLIRGAKSKILKAAFTIIIWMTIVLLSIWSLNQKGELRIIFVITAIAMISKIAIESVYKDNVFKVDHSLISHRGSYLKYLFNILAVYLAGTVLAAITWLTARRLGYVGYPDSKGEAVSLFAFMLPKFFLEVRKEWNERKLQNYFDKWLRKKRLK